MYKKNIKIFDINFMISLLIMINKDSLSFLKNILIFPLVLLNIFIQH